MLTAYARDLESAQHIADATATVTGCITEHFGPLIGSGAVLSLLARAIYVSRPWFKLLDCVPTGPAEVDIRTELVACLRGAQPQEALAAGVAVLGTFVWLLNTFIGQDLGMRLLRQACPESAPGKFDEESRHEPTQG